MRILYVAFKYDYGLRAQGNSYEHNNLFDSLTNMGHDILYFDVGSLLKNRGRDRMNTLLMDVVKSERPELMFVVLFRNELSQHVMRTISDHSDTVTFNWFCDDHWRFDNYSRYWAPCFNWVATTAESALPKYKLLGYPNVIKTQWACNHYQYRKEDLPLAYDASFVGQPHGDRPFVVQTIHDAGINIRVWGQGWSTGRASQAEMIRIFNQSKINLNLANASRAPSFQANLSAYLARRLLVLPLSARIRSRGLRLLAALGGDVGGTQRSRFPEQIKGRTFEVPGTGGFLLTGLAENLDQYFVLGKEVACFAHESDVVRKIRYYLAHEDERLTIASAGFRRTLASHTYVHRLCEIFRQIGLATETAETVLARKVTPGFVDELH